MQGRSSRLSRKAAPGGRDVAAPVSGAPRLRRAAKQAAISRFVVSVLVADRVGILRDITTALLDVGGQIDTLSQTVVEGYFTVTLTASFRDTIAPEAIRDRLARNFVADGASIHVQRCKPDAAVPVVAHGDRYVLIVMGRSRDDLTARLTSFLAGKRINIEDWYMDLRGDEAVYLSELTIPSALDLKQIQDEMARFTAPMGLRASLQHENIFRVTNEIGPVASLLLPAGGRTS